MPTFRRGVAAIQEAAEGKPQNKYRSFAPSISWSKDDLDKYVLILTPITEVVAAELQTVCACSLAASRALVGVPQQLAHRRHLRTPASRLRVEAV